MNPRIATIALTLLFISATLSAGTPPLTADFFLPDIPTAAVFGPEAAVLNPAALFINKPMGAQFYHSFAEGSFSGDNAFFIATGGVGLAYQRMALGYPEGVSRYDLAVSSKVMRNLYSGISYTYYKTDWSDLDKAHSWNLSWLWHLNPMMSLSAQIRNLNRNRFAGEESSIGYLLGAALRPLGDRVTIGGDLRIYGGQQLSDAAWRLSARAYVREGLAVYAAVGDRQRFGIGFEMQLGQSAVGAESFFTDDDGYDRTTVYFALSAAPRQNLYIGPGRILQVELSGNIPEEKQRPFLLWHSPETVYQKLSRIRNAKNDSTIKGLFLIVNNPAIGWGKLADFRAALQDFSSAGKKVICYLGPFSRTGAYYLASVADSVFTIPVDALYLIGLRAEVMFYAGALEKLDVEPEIEKMGKYKNAPNVYTEKSLTPEHREALEGLLDDIYDEICTSISMSRGVERSELEGMIDKGPFSSVEAESLGLIDGRVYPGELPERLPQMFGANWRLLSSEQYMVQPRFNERFGVRPRIAIISVVGDIVRGRSGASILGGKTSGSATISAAIRSCANDPDVAAIVVRLDTPGGGAVASDLIWSELCRARDKKPVVVSMSDICASGGYYIAAASDRIVVEPTSVTGAIGVYGGKANLAGFYKKLGLSTDVVERGKHASMFSWSIPYSDEERELLRNLIADLYSNFVSVVAQGRGLSVDSVDAIAQGRVWSGSSALRLGLADRQGSLLDAVTLAGDLAGLAESEYQVVELPERDRWPAFPGLIAMGLADILSGVAPGYISPISLLADDSWGTPQYKLPYELRIE